MNGIEDVLPKQETVMVPYNRQDRQLLSLRNKSPLSQNLWRRLKKNWGIPLTVVTKRNSSGKKTGIMKSKRKRSYKPSTKNDCLFKINCQYPNHHRNIRAKTQTRSNARSAEFRFEEHHEERVGTNEFWAFILCFLNREPGHIITLKSPSWSMG